jgi:glycosyltransferase involved in cell wall biosynthesis
MKVLHIVPSLLPESGGPSRTVPELCRALSANGTEVTLFSTHLASEGLTIDPAGEPHEVVLFPGADGALSGARQIYRAIRQRASDFDLIHIHSLWNLTVTLAAAAARREAIPYVLAPMGMLSEACLRQNRYALKRAYARTLDRRTVQGATRLHFLNADEQQASEKGWFRSPASFIARSGTDVGAGTTRPGSFRERFPELSDRRIMLFLGRLHAIKGLDLQLQALEYLIEKHPDLVWVLVGPDDGEWRRLNALIRSARLEEHVKWIGPLMGDERFSALADANVLVQTSFYECQSMTVNEGLAVGVPLVVTDSINYGEVQSAGAGYVVRRKPAELARAIESILESPGGGAAMRDAGRRFAAKELSWPTIARVVSTAYEGMLSLPENNSEVSKTGGRRYHHLPTPSPHN